MRRLLAIAAACAAAPTLAAADGYPINPGYWEVATNWLGVVKKTEHYCVEPEAIPRFLGGPCNHIYHCSYPLQEFSGGHTRFEGDIRGNNELYHVKGGGSYTPTTMNMHATGAGHWRFVPIVGAQASMRAHFLSETCPAGAKRIRQLK